MSLRSNFVGWVVILPLCGASLACARTSYVDAGTGSDTNDGTSWSQAWQSFDFGTPTITFGSVNQAGSNYLYVAKDWQSADESDVGGFPLSGKLVIDPAGPSPETAAYTNFSRDPIGADSRYRFYLTSALTQTWPESRFVYLHPDSHGPYTPGGSVAGGYGHQPGDVVMVRGTFTLVASRGLNFCNQLPATGRRVTYRADAAGATVYRQVTSWNVALAFVGANSLAFEGIEFRKSGMTGTEGIMRADRYVGTSPRILGATNMLFQGCRFHLSRRLSWTTLPEADWIGNAFYDFRDGVGGVMARPGRRVANNTFHNIALTLGDAPVTRAAGTAGNPAIVENNTFHDLGTTNFDFAVQADNEYVVIQNNIFAHIGGAAIKAPAGTPVDYNLFYACVTNYTDGVTGGTHDIVGRDPLFVATNIARRATAPNDLLLLPDLHLLSPYGYTTTNGAYLKDYSGPATPALDAGNPLSDYSNERQPNGNRIDIGAYGNTPENALSSRMSGAAVRIK